MFDDPLLLARAQFGLNIGFHILFPSITKPAAAAAICA
jgi:cytochrome bd-type quinol oxidase subunit 1